MKAYYANGKYLQGIIIRNFSNQIGNTVPSRRQVGRFN